MTQQTQMERSRVIRVKSDGDGRERLLKAIGDPAAKELIFLHTYTLPVQDLYDAVHRKKNQARKEETLLAGLEELIGAPSHMRDWNLALQMFQEHVLKRPYLKHDLDVTCNKLYTLAEYARAEFPRKLKEHGLEYLRYGIPVPIED